MRCLDPAFSEQLNPEAPYFAVSERPRSAFYANPSSLKACQSHSMFISQGHYPMRGPYFVLCAVPTIVDRHPDTQLFVGGGMFVGDRPSVSGGRSQMLRGAALSYLGIGLAIVSGIFVTPILVGHLGRNEYGLFTLSISVVTLLTFDLGLNSAVARFVANSEARGDRAETLEALSIVRRVYLILDMVLLFVLVAVWLGAESLFPALSGTEIQRFRILFAISGTMMFLNFPLYPANGTLQGLGRFVALRGSDVAWRAAGVVVTLVVVYADLMTFWLVFGWTLVALATSVYRAIICLRAGVWRWHMPPASKSMRQEITRYTSWSFFVALGQRLMITVMPAILAATAGTHEVTGFAIAAMFEGYVWLIANAVNGLFLPHVSRLVAVDDREAIQDLMERVGRFQLLVIGLFVSGFIVLGRAFIELWLGPGFDDVYLVTVLLILPSLVVQTQEVAMTVLIARGEIRFRALSTAIAAAINIGLALALTPSLGALGAAISVASGSVVGYVIAMNVAYARAMRLDIVRFFLRVHARILPPIALLVTVFLAMGQVWRRDSLPALAVAVVVFSVLYAAGAWFIMLNQDERSFARGMIVRLTRKGAGAG